MSRVVKLNGQWSAFEIALLTEMVARGDLLTEVADTLDRRREAMAAEGNYCCCGRSLSFHASFWSQPPPMLRLHMPMRV